MNNVHQNESLVRGYGLSTGFISSIKCIYNINIYNGIIYGTDLSIGISSAESSS